MKKLFTAIALFAFSTVAVAGFHGGNSAPKAKVRGNTVAAAKRAADDTYVTLRGYIVKSLGDEKYLFKDKTGSIRVEIDDDIWYGVNATPNTPVTIYGEVDRDHGYVEIDVKRISR